MQAGAEGTFMELTQDLFITQNVHYPTRDDNTLDLLSSVKPNMVDSIRVREPFSDHNIVI